MRPNTVTTILGLLGNALLAIFSIVALWFALVAASLLCVIWWGACSDSCVVLRPLLRQASTYRTCLV